MLVQIFKFSTDLLVGTVTMYKVHIILTFSPHLDNFVRILLWVWEPDYDLPGPGVKVTIYKT